ncbi:MAG: hypothetical protein FJ146_11725 [Deltaproteobacteria bacterium]|nr:hypothetical protein [Deltaproteobacteria bacterium]
MILRVFLQRTLLISGLVCGVTEAALAAPLNCGRQSLDSYVAAAQVLSVAATNEGASLLQCPALQEQVVQWQAFLLSMTGNQTAARALDVKLTGASQADPFIAKAKAGDYYNLLRQVDAHDVRYANNADALLVLARSLTRKGQFGRGRDIYQTYLKLRPDDDDVTAELLYSWIWQGDLVAADVQFTAASRWRNRPSFASQVQRGHDLIHKLRGQPSTQSDPIAVASKSDGTLVAGAGAHAISDVYLRHTAFAAYNGLIDVRVAGHQIEDLALTQDLELASEASVGFTLNKSTSYKLAAHIGYFSLGDSNIFGDLSGTIALKWQSQLTLGGYRRPLALLLPLTSDASGYMRDAIYIGGKLTRYAEFHIELRKEEYYAPHEWDQLLFKWPFVESSTDEITLRLPVQYFNQPQPNPEYDTYEVTTLVGAGMGWRRQLANGWDVTLNGDYYLVFMTPRMGGADADQTGLLLAEGAVKIPFNEFWALNATGRLALALDPEYVRRRGEVSHVTLGLSYSH